MAALFYTIMEGNILQLTKWDCAHALVLFRVKWWQSTSTVLVALELLGHLQMVALPGLLETNTDIMILRSFRSCMSFSFSKLVSAA